MSAPRITPLARPISEPTPDDDLGEEAVGDHRGRVLGGRPGLLQCGLVDAGASSCSAASSSASSVDRADLVGLVGHAADGGDHDAGHQGEQAEDDQPGGQGRLEPVALEDRRPRGLKMMASTAANVIGSTISLTAPSAMTTMIAATTNPTKLHAQTPSLGTRTGPAAAVAGVASGRPVGCVADVGSFGDLGGVGHGTSASSVASIGVGQTVSATVTSPRCCGRRRGE